MAASSLPERGLVLATRNPHKLAEARRILAPLGVLVQPLPEGVVLPPEDGETFAANALVKARAAAAAVGVDTIADDSGIEADALGGGPGVRSARYAGEHAGDAENLEKLLREVPPGTGLRYVCALAYAPLSGGGETVFLGECLGSMADRPRGSQGFGYDPVFAPRETQGGRTMAELSAAEKDRISHRGRALRAFASRLLG
jgi:XTP/dITP diphosphohydrolase